MGELVGAIFLLVFVGLVALLAIVSVLYVGAGIATVIFGGAFLKGLWDVGTGKVEREEEQGERSGAEDSAARPSADPADGY